MACRLFIEQSLTQPLDTEFMPLTKITRPEFKKLLLWLTEKHGSDVFQRGVYYNSLSLDELNQFYTIGADLIGNSETFYTALYM